MLKLLAIILLFLVTGPLTFAGEMEDGTAAFNNKNYSVALNKLYPLAINGVAEAQFILSRIYETEGVFKNDEEAFKWLSIAAKQGHDLALIGASSAYGKKGGFENIKEQVRLLKVIYLRGLVKSDNSLVYFGYSNLLYTADAYRRGKGIAQNYAESVSIYRYLADRGFIEAQWRLGLMYSSGQGVEKNYVESHKWLNLAASKPITEGDYFPERSSIPRDRDEVEGLMTSDQLKDAQRSAISWTLTK